MNILILVLSFYFPITSTIYPSSFSFHFILFISLVLPAALRQVQVQGQVLVPRHHQITGLEEEEQPGVGEGGAYVQLTDLHVECVIGGLDVLIVLLST